MPGMGARQANFEAIFASFDKGNKGGLTLQEMYQFTQATRLVRLCRVLQLRASGSASHVSRPGSGCALEGDAARGHSGLHLVTEKQTSLIDSQVFISYSDVHWCRCW